MRRYGPIYSNVASFVEVRAQGFVSRQAQTGPGGVYRKAWQVGGVLGAGIGAEWFPFRRMSLGATTGVSLSFGWGGGDLGALPVRQIQLNTYITALRMTIYF